MSGSSAVSLPSGEPSEGQEEGRVLCEEKSRTKLSEDWMKCWPERGRERERVRQKKEGKQLKKRQNGVCTYLSAVDYTALSSVSMSDAQREHGAGLQRGGWSVFTLFK